MQYRRAFIPGGTYFFTVVTLDRKPIFLDASAIGVLRKSFRAVQTKRPFQMDAIVLLPEHLHCLWTLPPGDSDYSTRWRLIKTWFTRHCHRGPMPNPDESQLRRGEQRIWQTRFWEHLIRDDRDFRHHIDYIHFNPVKHDLVTTVSEWPHSSFHRYVREGVLPENWADGGIDLPPDIGRE
jgi:putative transposase